MHSWLHFKEYDIFNILIAKKLYLDPVLKVLTLDYPGLPVLYEKYLWGAAVYG